MTQLTEDTKQMVDALHSVEVVMLTTQAPGGRLMTRPMALKGVDPDGTVWLFADASAPIAADIRAHAGVSVSYADSSGTIYLAISGKATLSGDRRRISELWTDDLLPYFPMGAGDPALVLIRIEPLVADRWDECIHHHIMLPR